MNETDCLLIPGFTYCKYYADDDDSGTCTITCLGALILLVAAVAIFILAAKCVGKQWYEKKKVSCAQ